MSEMENIDAAVNPEGICKSNPGSKPRLRAEQIQLISHLLPTIGSHSWQADCKRIAKVAQCSLSTVKRNYRTFMRETTDSGESSSTLATGTWAPMLGASVGGGSGLPWLAASSASPFGSLSGPPSHQVHAPQTVISSCPPSALARLLSQRLLGAHPWSWPRRQRPFEMVAPPQQAFAYIAAPRPGRGLNPYPAVGPAPPTVISPCLSFAALARGFSKESLSILAAAPNAFLGRRLRLPPPSRLFRARPAQPQQLRLGRMFLIGYRVFLRRNMRSNCWGFMICSMQTEWRRQPCRI